MDFRGSKQWDYRAHAGNQKWFRMDEGQELVDVKRRALSVLRSFGEAGANLTVSDLEGPIWALIDVSHGSEKVKAACGWFKVAASYTEDDDLRRVCCAEAYGLIERALRVYL